jgi:hypothetical protein
MGIYQTPVDWQEQKDGTLKFKLQKHGQWYHARSGDWAYTKCEEETTAKEAN